MLPILPPDIPQPKGHPQSLETDADALKLPHEPDTFESEIEIYHLSSCIGGPKLTLGCKRRRKRIRKKEGIVSVFLKKHGFVDLHSPRKSTRSYLARLLWGQQEKVYPVHQAAETGDYIIVLLSLRHGVDPFQKTSHGRTPLDLALAADVYGSHEDVIKALTEPPQTLSVQGFVRKLG